MIRFLDLVTAGLADHDHEQFLVQNILAAGSTVVLARALGELSQLVLAQSAVDRGGTLLGVLPSALRLLVLGCHFDSFRL